MLKAVLQRRALCAAFVATGLVCGALGILAAAAVARWAAGMAPDEPAEADLSPRFLTSVGVTSASTDAGIHEQASSRYAGGIMQDAVNG